MATHSSVLAWEIPWTEEPGRLQSTGSQRVRHNCATEGAHTHTHTQSSTRPVIIWIPSSVTLSQFLLLAQPLGLPIPVTIPRYQSSISDHTPSEKLCPPFSFSSLLQFG